MQYVGLNELEVLNYVQHIYRINCIFVQKELIAKYSFQEKIFCQDLSCCPYLPEPPLCFPSTYILPFPHPAPPPLGLIPSLFMEQSKWAADMVTQYSNLLDWAGLGEWTLDIFYAGRYIPPGSIFTIPPAWLCLFFLFSTPGLSAGDDEEILVCEIGQCHDTVALSMRTQMSVDLGHFRTPRAPDIDIYSRAVGFSRVYTVCIQYILRVFSKS